MHFLARIYFKIENGVTEKEQFDCQLRLIIADSSEEAFYIARAKAIESESDFLNCNGNVVKWKFNGITDLIPIDINNQGEELISTTIETDKEDRFSDYISLKNKEMAFTLSKKELIFSL